MTDWLRDFTQRPAGVGELGGWQQMLAMARALMRAVQDAYLGRRAATPIA